MLELSMDGGNLIRGNGFSEENRDDIIKVLKKIIEKGILPFIERKIRAIEGNVSNTRKGIKNQFKSLWKKSERGENDGLKENFKMNKEEIELRSLIDIAMVC
jgi:ER-Golgi trafficking TRAPP I complex 85 kDa subunit